jgi:DnaJ-class molecular chaperone
LKTYYDLLGLQPSADADEVKRAFRREIARYHPDKVQHLGPEFQEIAASRAAELTEAYRILMDAEARQSYDAMLTSGAGATQAPHVPPAGENRAAPAPPPAAATPPPHRAPEPPGGPVHCSAPPSR